MRMNTAPSYVDTRIPLKRPVPEEPSRELDPQQIDALVHGTRPPTVEEHELIEMRYQHLLARMMLEEVFCEAQMGTR
jgi:hypothetical protein